MTWKHNFKPPSGIPAGGQSFMGWGGPPKGRGTGGPARAFMANSPTRGTGAGNPAKMAKCKRLAAEIEARIEQLIENLGDIALNDPNSMARISASVHVLNRIDGLPVATQRNENRDMTLEELVLGATKREERLPK
jgi:hypothetical protein